MLKTATNHRISFRHMIVAIALLGPAAAAAPQEPVTVTNKIKGLIEDNPI